MSIVNVVLSESTQRDCESVQFIWLWDSLGTLLTAHILSSSSSGKVNINTSQDDSWGGGEEERRYDQKVCFDREAD